jgi:hypothetical protein
VYIEIVFSLLLSPNLKVFQKKYIEKKKSKCEVVKHSDFSRKKRGNEKKN